MSTNSREINLALKYFSNNNGKGDNRNLFFTAEVKKVDDETCDVEIAETTYTGVHLAAVSDGNKNNIIIKPKVGSVVLICDKTGGDMSWMNVVAFTEIANITGVIDENIEIKINGEVKIECDTIKFNGGKNEGLVKILELEKNLKQLKNYCELLKTATSSGIKAVGVAMSASGTNGAAAFDLAMEAGDITFGDMKNDKIKH